MDFLCTTWHREIQKNRNPMRTWENFVFLWLHASCSSSGWEELWIPALGALVPWKMLRVRSPSRRFPWCNSGTSSHWPKFERVEKVIFADAMVWDLVGSGFLPLGAHLAKQKYWGNLFLLNWKCIWAMFPKLAVHQNPCGDLLKICIPGLLPDLQSDSEPSKYQNPTFSKAVSVSPMQPIFACAGGKLNSNSYYSYVVWL